jgi:anti-sigma regulatory factor (Ser/Thr protein kinase)
MTRDSQAGLSLTVQFLPSWSEIDPLRAYVESCARNQTVQLSERTGMVAQELLENAVKYGDPSAMEADIRVRVERDLVTVEASIR